MKISGCDWVLVFFFFAELIMSSNDLWSNGVRQQIQICNKLYLRNYYINLLDQHFMVLICVKV